jgi:integrase
MAIMAFEQQRGPHAGASLLSGFAHVYPEVTPVKVHLPEARRALDGWERFQLGEEGLPMPQEAVGAVAAACMRVGEEAVALVAWLSFDCLLRQQDWRGLRTEDVSIDREEVSFRFGVRARGERVKTGSDQGVSIDRLWLRQWFRTYLAAQQLGPGGFVFGSIFARFDVVFGATQTQLQLERNTPHGLRHGGASQMILDNLSLDEVRRRGRWAQEKSCRRYLKTHELTRIRAAMPATVRRLGERFLAAPLAELARHRRRA